MTDQKKSHHLKLTTKGQSLVEFSILLVILLLLLSGIVDLGRAIFMKFALQDAAEEGIVYGIMYPTKCSLIKTRVSHNLQESSGMSVTPEVIVKIKGIECVEDSTTLKFGDKMEIEVSSPFAITMPFLTGGTLNLKGTANGTILRPKPE